MKLTKKLLKDVQKSGLNLDRLTELLLEDCKRVAREITEACAQEVNQQMRAGLRL